MGEDWKSVLKVDPTNWLLEPENPSVRYFTLRDLLHYPSDDQQLLEARGAIRSSSKVAKIFSNQQPGGFWESASQPYVPKYKATYWQLIILSLLGLDKSDERIRKMCDYIWQFQHEDGGFCSIMEEGARMKYEHIKARMVKRDEAPPPFEEWAPDEIKESEMTCLTGNVGAALIKMGYADDERVHSALNWLVEVQNQDGGWLCPYWKAHINDKHGCFMGTIPSLDAFSELPVEFRTPEMESAIERGAEFLLMHRLYKADHHEFKVIKPLWLKLGFPCFFYDILRGLDVVTRLGYVQDERIQDALGVILSKQGVDGKWVLETTPTGRMQTNLETKGRPSKWITMNALRVIERIYPS